MSPRQAKVCNLDCTMLVYQEVGRLQIPVRKKKYSLLAINTGYNFHTCEGCDAGGRRATPIEQYMHSNFKIKDGVHNLQKLVGPRLDQHWINARLPMRVDVFLQVHRQIFKDKIQFCLLQIYVTYMSHFLTCIRTSFRQTMFGC